MKPKVNTIGQKVTVDEVFGRKDGDKEAAMDKLATLTEAEKIQVAVLIEKSGTLQAQFKSVSEALSSLINSIVVMRGFDPKKYGVNLAAGKVLLMEETKTKGR